MRMTDIADQIKAVAIDAEKTANDPMPAHRPPTQPNKSAPVPVRLAPQDVAQIEQLAKAMNVRTSTLIRGWIQQRLAARDENTIDSVIDQISADVQRLRELVA
jgi:hypothetical protein